MLTDLSFLEPGKPWPPPSEAERLERYAYNRKLFANDCDEKYREQAKRIERNLQNGMLERKQRSWTPSLPALQYSALCGSWCWISACAERGCCMTDVQTRAVS